MALSVSDDLLRERRRDPKELTVITALEDGNILVRDRLHSEMELAEVLAELRAEAKGDKKIYVMAERVVSVKRVEALRQRIRQAGFQAIFILAKKGSYSIVSIASQLKSLVYPCWRLIPESLASRRAIALRVFLNYDGSLAKEPIQMAGEEDESLRVPVQNALRALINCAPYDELPAGAREVWQGIEITLDPLEVPAGRR